MKPSAIRPPPPRKSRTRKWFARHHRIITYLGASIVIATFVVKEGFREWKKDEVAKIEAAQRQFDTEDAISQLDQKTEWASFGDLTRLDPSAVSSPVDDEVVRKNTRHLARWADYRRMDLYNIDKLAQSLPRCDEYRAQCNRLNAMVSAVGREGIMQRVALGTKELNEEMSRLFGKNATHLDTDAFPKTPLAAALPVYEAVGIDEAVLKFRQRVLDDANVELVWKERHLLIATWASYGLYFIGWSLGLLGRLIGEKSPNEE